VFWNCFYLKCKPIIIYYILRKNFGTAEIFFSDLVFFILSCRVFLNFNFSRHDNFKHTQIFVLVTRNIFLQIGKLALIYETIVVFTFWFMNILNMDYGTFFSKVNTLTEKLQKHDLFPFKILCKAWNSITVMMSLQLSANISVMESLL